MTRSWKSRDGTRTLLLTASVLLLGCAGLLPGGATGAAEAQVEELPIGGPGASAELDLAVTVDDGVDLALVGREVVYTVRVTNSGPADAVGARVRSRLPEELTGVTWVCDPGEGGRCPRGTGSGGLDELVDVRAAGAVTFTVRARLQPDPPARRGDELVFGVRVEAPQGFRELDPSDDADLDVNRVIPTLTVFKEVGGSFVPGGTIRYTITLVNETGTLQPDNPQPELLDPLPPEIDLVEAAASRGRVTFDLQSGLLRWDGSIPGHGSVVITVDARIRDGVAAGREVENRGRASFSLVYDASNDTIAASASNDALAFSSDPRTGGPTVFRVLAGTLAIPAADAVALLALALLLGLAATLVLGRS